MKNIGIDAHAIGLRQGGNETYAYGMLKGLSEIGSRDFKYSILLSRDVPVPEFLQNNSSFSISRVSRNEVCRFMADIPVATYAGKLDLLHTQYHLPLAARCPGVITLHDVSFLRHPEFFPKQLYWRFRLLLSHSIKKAKKIITVSEFSKKEIVAFYNVPPEKIDVIYNGFSEKFKPEGIEKRDGIMKKYGITLPYILSVSNLQPRKNLSRLIKAFVSLVKNSENFSCDMVIVGQKLWLYDEIFNEVKNTQLKERIIMTDYVPEEDIVSLCNFAEALVYPSVYEGFGLPVLEAMACGCPVITSNVSSLPEVAGEACILVNPYDTEAIANAILAVTGNPDLRLRLKTAGIKQAGKFSWKKTAEETLNVYEQALFPQ